MVNIIKSDLYRMRKGKSIYIVLIMMMIFSFASIYGMSPGRIGVTTSNQEMDLQKYDEETLEKIKNANSLNDMRAIMKENGNYDLDKEIIGTNVNLYYIFIVIVFIGICADFSNSSIKNTLTSAISRKKYYFSKLLFCLGVGTTIIFFNTYFIYFLNLVLNGTNFSSSIWEVTKLTLFQLPLLYGIISLLVGISFLTKKAAVFNSVSIPFIMVVQLILFGIISLFKINAPWILDYEVQFALSNLATNPTTMYILKCTLLGGIYSVLFNAIGYFSFKKAEIK